MHACINAVDAHRVLISATKRMTRAFSHHPPSAAPLSHPPSAAPLSHPAHSLIIAPPLIRRSALYHKVLPCHLVPRVVAHPSLHLCIMVAQILPPFDQLPDWKLKAMFWMFLVRPDRP